MIRKLFTALAVSGAIAAPAAAQMKEVNFGFISTDSSIALRQRWQPVLDDMSARINAKVNPFFATDYAGVIEAMRFRKVDLAWFGNKAAIEAVDRANGEVFMQTVKPDGDGYYSVLITHRDSPFKTLEDVFKRGKEINFGIGDPNSTSGFVVPSYYVFSQNGIDARGHFKTLRAANHETNLMAVLNRQLDVATNNTEQLYVFKNRLPARYDEIRVLWTSPLIPSDPIVWRKDIDGEMKVKLRTFFAGYGKGPNGAEEQKKLLGIQEWVGFKESSNAQLLPIRQIELFQQKTKLEADASLPTAEKRAKVEEIDHKLADLGRQLAAASKK